MWHSAPMTMSLGNKLTWYLLIGVLAVTGLDTYLSFTRSRANLIEDLRAEVAAISRTLRVTLEMSGDDTPERYFDQLAGSISGFENILGLVFYNRTGQVVATSAALHGKQLPAVDVRTVMTTRTPVEGLFVEEGSLQHYYRLEPILDSTGQGIAAFLIIENLPFLTQEVRSRALQTLLTTLVLMTVLAVIVSLVIRRSVTLPLRTFAHRIEAIGQGHLDQRLHMARKDEIGQLAQEFDRMCAQLETAQQKLVAESEEKLRLERALRHSEKLAALGQLASRLAHEIGTPLNVIHGRAEQLLQRNSLSERERAFLGIIVAQIERISGFIRQLLTLARRPEPQRCVVQPNEIVQRVWEVIGERRHTPQVQVTMTLAPNLPPIWGNPDQLQQVILNLSVNALQAVDSGGEVSLSTRLSPNGDPQSGRMVEIIVADTGPGIPPDNIPHLFEPFFTTKDVLGGSGLGLAISHEIVLSHQGAIRVESELGQGTRFIVALPQLRAQTTPQTAETSRVPISVS